MGFQDFIKSFTKKEVRAFNAADDTAQTSNLPFLHSWFWSAHLGIPRGINFLEIRQYAKSCWVQMVTNAISKQIMTTKWDVVKTDEEDQTDYSEDIDRIKKLLLFPNRNGDTFWDVWGPPMRDAMEIDAGVIFKGRNVAGEVVELYTYDGATFLKSPDEHGILEKYYQYSFRHFGAKPREFKKEDVIYMMMNPSNETFPYGFSPLQSIQQEVELMIQSTRYNKEFFKNNAIPDGIVGIDMDEDAIPRFQADWEAKFKGKAHKLMFHNNPNMNFVNLKTTNRDMEWLDGQKWFFHMVFGAYGLSPQEVGFYENSNRATGESQERITIKNAIKPYLKLIEDKINREIIFDLLGHDKIKFKWFPKDSAQEKIEHQQNMEKLDKNVYTINEIRTMEGKDPVPWGDQPFSFVQQDRFIANGGRRIFEGRAEEYDNKPNDRDLKEDRDDKKEEREKDNEKLPKSTNLVDQLIKQVEFVEQDEAKDYAEFLQKKFGKWEKAIFSFLDDTLKDEFHKSNNIDMINKTFGDFLRRLANTINTIGFKEGLKKVLRINFKEGIEEAEKELNLDIGFSEDFEKKLDFIADRQLVGFHIEGKKWNGIKGVAEELQKRIAEIVRTGLSEKKGLKGIKNEIKTLMVQHVGGKVEGEVTEGRAMKIARTESNRTRNFSRLESYKKSGIVVGKRWVALMDNKTTDICRRLHGQVRPLNEPFTDEVTGKQFIHPPALPNCRSVMDAVLKE
jgi:HK97 family phage portal protein